MTEFKENKMGVMPVRKLIISMSLPMMISMLVQALYNVVDSVFVARIGEHALTAVTLDPVSASVSMPCCQGHSARDGLTVPTRRPTPASF